MLAVLAAAVSSRSKVSYTDDMEVFVVFDRHENERI